MPRRGERPSRHGWNTFEHYFNAHDRRIDDLCNEGFIVEDGLTKTWLSDDIIVIQGRLRCQHGLFVDVRKYLVFRHA